MISEKEIYQSGRHELKKLDLNRRKPISVSQDELVKIRFLPDAVNLPLVIQPAVEGIDLATWALNHQRFIESHLCQHGALLFRNFNVRSVAEFERFIIGTSSEWAEYREAATPRRQINDNIHTSTEYPADQYIFLHNENSHCDSWPQKIYFFCVTPAQHGGETPIADCRNIFAQIAPEIRERFLTKKVMYVRNFGAGLGFPWQTVFKTTEKAGVEEYCRKAGIKAEWKDDDHLRISYVREAVAKHPRTNELIWFNHATFFHVSTLESSVRNALLSQMPESDLPYNTYYGDGSPIEPSILDELRAIYRRETIAFPWQEGDVLMLDNMLVAHGRAPFTGQRRILVGMSDPFGS